MNEVCERCPCPDVCLRRPTYCEWAAKDPPNPVEIRAICNRSRIEHGIYPSISEQAANLLGAAGRVVAAAARGEAVKVPPAVYYERLAICGDCPFNGERATGGMRCTKCGCGGMKLEFATEHCPVGRW